MWLDPLGISRDVRLVRSLHRVDGPADPVADDLQVLLKRGGALGQPAGTDARRDAIRGQPVHAIQLVLARAAEPVVDVTHAELAQPGPHSAEVAVGGVEPREADIDAHGVPERAGRGRRNEWLGRGRGRGPRRRNGPGPDGDRHQHVQDRQDWEEPAVDRWTVLGIRFARARTPPSGFALRTPPSDTEWPSFKWLGGRASTGAGTELRAPTGNA